MIVIDFSDLGDNSPKYKVSWIIDGSCLHYTTKWRHEDAFHYADGLQSGIDRVGGLLSYTTKIYDNTKEDL